MKLVVYTAVFGNYDSLHAVKKNTNVDFYIVTNNSQFSKKGWKTIYWDNSELTDYEKNRFVKMHPDQFLREYEISIYVDGNIQIIGDIERFLLEYNAVSDFSILRHRTRECVYEEIQECLCQGKISQKEAEDLTEYYLSKNMPKNYGLSENCVLVRNHNNESIKNLMEEWWSIYKSGIKRDQLSLPFLLWKHQLSVNFIKLNIRKPNLYFIWRRHKPELIKSRIKQIKERFRTLRYKLYAFRH